MAVKTYGANANLALDGDGISGTDIAEEHGGDDQTNVKMSDYYAGGSLVPAGTNGYPSGGSATAIPSSGQISMNNFFGSSSVLTMPSGTYTGYQGTPGSAGQSHVVSMQNEGTGSISIELSQVGIRVYGSTNSVEIQVRRMISQDVSVWYNPSRVASTLTTSWQTIWSMPLLPDSVKWRASHYTNNTGNGFNQHQESTLSCVTSQLSSSYQTINTSTTLGRNLVTSSLSECYQTGYAQRWYGYYFDFRKSGYSDAEGHATFNFYLSAETESTWCF